MKAPPLADALFSHASLADALMDPIVAGLLGLAVGLGLGGCLGAALSAVVTARLGARRNAALRDRFAALSNEALDRTSDRFLTLASERLGALERSNVEALAQRELAVEALVHPLRETLARVDEKLQQVETERQGHYRSLTKHLELVATAHAGLEQKTQDLAQALRTPNVRGRWGELQLRRVVELAGMLDHCDFREQPPLETGLGTRDAIGRAGATLRPDLVVRLPGRRQVIIDAKAPLHAYLAASEATDDAERTRLLAEHAKHVRRHVDELGGRAYWSRLGESPEFVVLFLPGEPFFSAALAEDPELIERGVERKVLLAGPTTLIALLRAVAYGWQQEAMAENATRVSQLGRELFERISTLGDRFGVLGKKLDGAVEAYNAAIGTLESRVQVSARRMAELGVAKDDTLAEIPTVDRRTRPIQDPPQTGSGTVRLSHRGGSA